LSNAATFLAGSPIGGGPARALDVLGFGQIVLGQWSGKQLPKRFSIFRWGKVYSKSD
jgi:hypothetical protein